MKYLRLSQQVLAIGCGLLQDDVGLIVIDGEVPVRKRELSIVVCITFESSLEIIRGDIF